MASRYVTWCLVWLLPVAPVVLLYTLFREANAFAFEDAPGGVRALGPIAAYLVLLVLSLRNRRLLEGGLPDDERHLLGDWAITATSRHGHTATGTCRISDTAGDLALAGTFNEGGALTSTWQSAVARLDGARLVVVYDLHDRERDLRTEGLMRLVVDSPKRPTRLVGDWEVVGHEGTMGSVELVRVQVSASPVQSSTPTGRAA